MAHDVATHYQDVADWRAYGGGDRDFEFWRHFTTMGAADKNTMVAVVPWLLALSASILAFLFTRQFGGGVPATVAAPAITAAVAGVGLAVSVVAAAVTLIYAGYANRNWALADRIAMNHKEWRDLLPDYMSDGRSPETKALAGIFANLSWAWARPCVPECKIAPIFGIFVVGSLLFGAVHFVFLVTAAVAAA